MLFGIAEKLLKGRGDADQGEWRIEATGTIKAAPMRIAHLQRRVTFAEGRKVGPLIDYRDNIYEKLRRAEICSKRCGLSIESLMDMG